MIMELSTAVTMECDNALKSNKLLFCSNKLLIIVSMSYTTFFKDKKTSITIFGAIGHRVFFMNTLMSAYNVHENNSKMKHIRVPCLIIVV